MIKNEKELNVMLSYNDMSKDIEGGEGKWLTFSANWKIIFMQYQG